MENASADGLEDAKTGDSLQQTQAAVAALQQQRQHWEIHLRRLQVKWIHLFRPDYAQALVLKDEYRALWDNGASAPRKEWPTPYMNLYGVGLIGGRWLVSTVDTADAATGNENVDASAQGDPADPVRSFYADVAAHDYAAGYALFSDDLKSRLPDEAAWAHRFDHTVTTHVPNSEVVYRDAILASVTLSHETTFATAGGQETRPYVGTWLLHYEHDSWRLDHVVVVSAR